MIPEWPFTGLLVRPGGRLEAALIMQNLGVIPNVDKCLICNIRIMGMSDLRKFERSEKKT